MALSEAKKRANQKWNNAHLKERYDRVQLVLPKGKKELVKALADSQGATVNSLINRLLDAELEKCGYGPENFADTQTGAERDDTEANT